MDLFGGRVPPNSVLRNYRPKRLNTEHDIHGATVYGRNDEKLGKISALIFDPSRGANYVVVDTGAAFSHKKFLVPTHRHTHRQPTNALCQ